jgi:hypothetical protein
MRKLVVGLWASILFLAAPQSMFAHGGGLDAYGCHHSGKLGGYHCHRGQFAGRSFASQAEMLQQLNARSSSQTTPAPELNQSPPLGNPNARVWVNAFFWCVSLSGHSVVWSDEAGLFRDTREGQDLD